MDSSSRLLLNSTSSLWGDENACSSTLRARLRDDHTPATSSSTKPAPYQDVYQQVQACLGNHLLAPKPDKKIAQTATLSECNDLYSNIAYPLSATLCHSDNHPRATIATHLANLKKDIAAAKEEILRLSDE
ncbi:hypothetical protein MRS44_010734 [Fusarium solani]|uniref:uncharacterized protein n=1 Tax=Fusarium solani TaxID=169388 RepID=UPI0032C3E3C6|nr:hypothetical protein MRS44_010734 [Fusarium solani]